MLTVAQAARYATVPERLIRAWIAAGVLPVLQLGAPEPIRVSRQDLDAALASFRVTSTRSDPIHHQPGRPDEPS